MEKVSEGQKGNFESSTSNHTNGVLNSDELVESRNMATGVDAPVFEDAALQEPHKEGDLNIDPASQTATLRFVRRQDGETEHTEASKSDSGTVTSGEEVTTYENRRRFAEGFRESINTSDEKTAKTPNEVEVKYDDDLISESGEPTPEQLAKDAAKKVVDYSEYITLMEKRVASLEAQMRSGDAQKKAKESKSQDKKRVPAIPRLRHVTWAGFKNRIKDSQEIYAVEVLIGDVKYYYQRNKQQRQARLLANDGSHAIDEFTAPQPTRAPREQKSHVERIRINSVPLLMILADILDLEISTEPTVHLHPFKVLARHNRAIRAVLSSLESRWDLPPEEPYFPRGKQSQLATDEQGLVPSARLDKANHFQAFDREPKAEALYINKFNEPATRDENIGSTKPEDLMDSVEAMNDLRCLVQFMDEEVGDPDRYRKPDPPARISFRDLWHLFRPGDELFSPIQAAEDKDDKQPEPTQNLAGLSQHRRSQEAWRVVNIWGGRPNLSPESEDDAFVPKQKLNAFVLYCYYLDFSGKKFVVSTHNLTINPFEGEVVVTSLEVYPWAYVQDGARKRDALKQRGELFREFVTFKYRLYKGPTLICQPCGCALPRGTLPTYSEEVESEVIVDFAEAIRDDRYWAPIVKGGNSTGLLGRETEDDLDISIWKDGSQEELFEDREDFIFDDYVVDHAMTTELEANDPLLKDDPDPAFTGGAALRDMELILLPARVLAYVFRKQYFAALNIEYLEPVIKPYKQGWKDLQLPQGHKQMLRSLVKTHLSEKQSKAIKAKEGHAYDIVQGKGQGLIVLLHGVPGVGKTSTAETVAESEGKPLLSITCGDLGLTAESVEKALDHKFHLASAWDCVLLLDEADVFLAARTHNDIQRNALVSVFLRVLEYYTGILFLTTNRVGAFDDAFKSRIHLPLYYPPLDIIQTKKIWEVNLERTLSRKEPLLVADKAEIMTYAESHFYAGMEKGAAWNGRQIRNAFQTATALAEFEAYERQAKEVKAGRKGPSAPVLARLKQRHFDVVAQASFTFDRYLISTHDDEDSAERAKAARERDDAFAAANVTVRNEKFGFRRKDPRDPQNDPYGQMGYQNQEPVQVGMSSAHRKPSMRQGQAPILKPNTVTSPRKSQQQLYFPTPDNQGRFPRSDHQGHFPMPENQVRFPMSENQLYAQSQGPYLAHQGMMPDNRRYESFQSQHVLSPQRTTAPKGNFVTPTAQTYSDDNEDEDDVLGGADEDDY